MLGEACLRIRITMSRMGFLDSLKAWLKTEASEAQDLGRKTKSRMEADLDRREADLNLSPEQRLEQLQGKISDGDSVFESLQDKIDGREALADATADLTDAPQNAEDVMDLDSEEVIPPEPPPT